MLKKRNGTIWVKMNICVVYVYTMAMWQHFNTTVMNPVQNPEEHHKYTSDSMNEFKTDPEISPIL